MRPALPVLELAPDTLIATEIAPDGQIQLFDQPTSQLVDRSVVDAMTLLAQSKGVGPDADAAAFLQTLEERGPRVATSLRDLANTLAASQFETEFSWTEPRKAALNLRMSVPDLLHLGKLVASRELEKEPVQLEGILRTVSDISPLKLEIGKGEYETVNATEIDKSVIKSLSVGRRVRISTEVTEEKSPGGAPVTHFKATRIEVLEH
ncbi:hypothetical protein E3O62_13125 [Cryobacterium sp. TMT2-15-1]|uniref:hypothetical protein n=1 Tax=Cryobacterium sp. TMT2-15-1 TaxID=1259246 RepID=UPI001069A87A|nr:hypothetical protein [Cryobacterium sp. TMT2-15-1]TFC56041.1 hypothetical protein E3O62_13125 [Cryobacterium sp. TMT2-15-1]